jgi:hypothetical protein
MSQYIYNLGACIERALSGVPRAQPAQIAGYWANRDFWLAEFEHLLAVIDGFDARLEPMRIAYEEHSQRLGGEHNADEFGVPRQRVSDPTSPQQRRQDAAGARSALKKLADRSLDLKIADANEYDAFVIRLRITGREHTEAADFRLPG